MFHHINNNNLSDPRNPLALFRPIWVFYPIKNIGFKAALDYLSHLQVHTRTTNKNV